MEYCPLLIYSLHNIVDSSLKKQTFYRLLVKLGSEVLSHNSSLLWILDFRHALETIYSISLADLLKL